MPPKQSLELKSELELQMKTERERKRIQNSAAERKTQPSERLSSRAAAKPYVCTPLFSYFIFSFCCCTQSCGCTATASRFTVVTLTLNYSSVCSALSSAVKSTQFLSTQDDSAAERRSPISTIMQKAVQLARQMAFFSHCFDPPSSIELTKKTVAAIHLKKWFATCNANNALDILNTYFFGYGARRRLTM